MSLTVFKPTGNLVPVNGGEPVAPAECYLKDDVDALESQLRGDIEKNFAMFYDEREELAKLRKLIGPRVPFDPNTPEARRVTSGSVWRHFKGTTAEVITVCKHSETGEDLVVYRCSGNEGKTNHTDGLYARPLSMFLSEVDHTKYPDVKQKYRLEKIK
jgi:hypothetical protein